MNPVPSKPDIHAGLCVSLCRRVGIQSDVMPALGASVTFVVGASFTWLSSQINLEPLWYKRTIEGFGLIGCVAFIFIAYLLPERMKRADIEELGVARQIISKQNHRTKTFLRCINMLRVFLGKKHAQAMGLLNSNTPPNDILVELAEARYLQVVLEMIHKEFQDRAEEGLTRVILFEPIDGYNLLQVKGSFDGTDDRCTDTLNEHFFSHPSDPQLEQINGFFYHAVDELKVISDFRSQCPLSFADPCGFNVRARLLFKHKLRWRKEFIILTVDANQGGIILDEDTDCYSHFFRAVAMYVDAELEVAFRAKRALTS